MALIACKICGKKFEAGTDRRRRYCEGFCFSVYEARQASARRKTWSPERRRAGNLVAAAIFRGNLKPRPCEVCGATRDIDAHHDDYSKPLDVRWLCRAHHKQHHEKLRREEANRPLAEFLSHRRAVRISTENSEPA